MSDGAFGAIQADERLRSLYVAVLARLDQLGPYAVQHRKAGVVLVNGGAFLTVAPALDGLRLTVAGAVIVVRSPGDVDDALVERLRAAFRAHRPGA